MHRHFISFSNSLDLHRAQTMLPKGDIGGDTILTVVQEDNPIIPIVSYRNLFMHGTSTSGRLDLHSIRVHLRTSVELVVLEVSADLLEESSSLRLEILDLRIRSTSLLQLRRKGLQVAYIGERLAKQIKGTNVSYPIGWGDATHPSSTSHSSSCRS